MPRKLLWLLFGAPAGLLLLSYGGICLHVRSLWPWNHVVHEDGRRTLIATILYFDHAARELPLDLLLAAAIAGGALYGASPASPLDGPAGEQERRWRRRAASASAATIAIILAGTLATGGVASLLENLAEMPTREGEPLVWGAHWRYHLLERLALMLVSFAGTAIAASWVRSPIDGERRAGLRLFGAALAMFALATILFVPTIEPFVDPRFLGHQARELLTHITVTAPLAAGVALAMSMHGQESSRSPRAAVAAIAGLPLWAAVSGVAMAAYVGVGAIVLDARATAQTVGFVPLVLSHYFEHSFTYLVVSTTAVCLVGTAVGRRTLYSRK